MITAAALSAKSLKELRSVASRYGIERGNSLDKQALVKAIVRATQAKSSRSAKGSSGAKPSGGKRLDSKAGRGAASRSGRGQAGGSKAPVGKANGEIHHKHRAAAGGQGRTTLNGRSHRQPASRSTTPAKGANRAQPVGKKGGGDKGKGKGQPKAKAKSPRVTARIQMVHAIRDRQKNLATETDANAEVKVVSVNGNGHGSTREIHKSSVKKDRVVLLVRDAYWIQVVWELTRQSVERAQVALAQQWHSAKPVLRLIELESNSTTSAVEQVARIVPIHGGVNTWFLDVMDSPKTYRVDIGYMTASNKFFALGRSNAVTTPRPGSGDGLENNWSDIANDCEKIYALSGGFSDEVSTNELQEAFEERLGRPMGGPSGSRFGVGADKVFTRRSEFQFDVDAEMIIFGRTRTNARVTLAGNPVKLRADGTFAARLAMPDRRQVLPIVASSADGVEQRTVVIAVERNTKVMEPMLREASE